MQLLGFNNKGVTYTNKQTAPALFPVATQKILNNGPSAAEIMPSTEPPTNNKIIKKMKPVKTPMATQASIIFGPPTAGLGISSIM